MTTNKSVYELGFLLVPTLTDAEVAPAVEKLHKAITNAGGSVTTSGEVHFIDLAYEMVKKIKSKNHRFDQAHFGWVKFEAAGTTPTEVEKGLKGIDEVLRGIVVKTVADDAVTDLYAPEEDEMPQSETVDLNEGVDMGSDSSPEKTEDDLTRVEGIGPKIAETLVAAGVTTFKALSETSSDKIQDIIKDVRGSHDSETWPKQAAMAANGDWDGLKAWQEELTGGKE